MAIRIAVCRWCKKPIIDNPDISGPLYIHAENEDEATHVAQNEESSKVPGPGSYPMPKNSSVA